MAENTLTEVFSDIADAIRAKGVSGTMTPAEMPQKIASITGGADDFGIPLAALLGDVDQNGALQAPSYVGTFEFSSDKIEEVPYYRMYRKFYNSTNITKVELPNLATVGQYAMQNMCYGCTSLTSVDLSSLTDVSERGLYAAFNGCTSLTSVDLSSLQRIQNYGLYQAFNGCTSLTSVDLSSLTTLFAQGLYQAFSGCTSLVSVDLSNLVDASASYSLNNTFFSCTSLKNVYMNKTSVGYASAWTRAFYGCTALELADFSLATAVPAISTNTFGNTNSTFKIVVPDALYTTWIEATNWSTLASQIIKVSEYQASLSQ